MDHNELGTEEESDFAVRYFEDAESADDDELYQAEVENELPRS